MIHRRLVVVGAAVGWMGADGTAVAQRAERVFRVGILRPGVPPLSPADPQVTGIPTALRELGYVDGRNVAYVTQWGGGDLERLPGLARALLDDKVDLVVAVGTPAVQAMKRATSTVPIVMYGNFDPVALGLVASLSRPGGNVTGVLIAPDGTLAGKRLELLRAAVPQARRIGLLVPADESIQLQVQQTRAAARELGIELPVVAVRGDDYAGAFAELMRERVAAVVVGSHQYFVRDRQAIVKLAAAHRLPAMYEWREQVVEGGLMTYSTSPVRHPPARGDVRRSHPQGRQPGRSAGGAADQVRPGDQSEGGEGTRTQLAAVAVAACGRGDSMRRRAMVWGVGCVGAGALRIAAAQHTARVPRVGLLTPGSPPQPGEVDGFAEGLRDQGYLVGKTIVVERRHAHGHLEQLSCWSWRAAAWPGREPTSPASCSRRRRSTRNAWR
jgi:putative ABC transport system substrate-binding protein